MDEVRFDHVDTGRNGVVGSLLAAVATEGADGLPRLAPERLEASDMLAIHRVDVGPLHADPGGHE